jgi:hypothetical protein
MAIQELDDLFGLLATPEDKAQLERILTTNQQVLDQVKSSMELHRAFVDCDRAAIQRLEAAKPTIQNSMTITPTPVPAAAATTTSPASPASPAFDMTKLDELVEQRTRSIFDQLLKTDTFNSAVKGLVKTTADELAPNMYSTASRTANEIYDIKSAHKDEFHSPLDMTKFNEYLETNKGKFSTLTDSYNSFVNEERVQARIKQGIQEGLVAERSTQVPGGTLGKSKTPSMADMFVAVNKTKFDDARGTGLDQAAQALRNTRLARTE